MFGWSLRRVTVPSVARPSAPARGFRVRQCRRMAGDQRYVALDSRRGMDYHRLRPQSVPHALPKGGVSRQATDSSRSISLALCSIPKLMPIGSTSCSSKPWRLFGRPWWPSAMTWLRLRGRLVFGITNRRHDRRCTRQEGELTRLATTVVTLADLRIPRHTGLGPCCRCIEDPANQSPGGLRTLPCQP